MSRKRNSLSQSISSLAASVPDIPVPRSEPAVHANPPSVGDHTDHSTTPEPDNGKDSPFSGLPEGTTSESPLDLFTKWSLTPEGHRVRDNRVPTDPVRLGCILDDNARIAFMAGYAAATPSFE